MHVPCSMLGQGLSKQISQGTRSVLVSKPYDGPISLNNKKRQTHCKESFFLFVINRTGKRSTFGLLKDGINSVIRYYKNNFADGFRQVSM